MGLLEPPISRPPHPQRIGRLRHGSFDPRPTFVEFFERSRSAVVPVPLAALSVGLWGVTSARAVRWCSACIGTARHIPCSPFCETPPEWWACLVGQGPVSSIGSVCRSGTSPPPGPNQNKLARIKSLLVMGLPAWILPHGPRQRDLIVLLTAHQAITRHIRPIDYNGPWGARPGRPAGDASSPPRVTSWSVAKVVSTCVISWGHRRHTFQSDGLYTRASGAPVCHCTGTLDHTARQSAARRADSSSRPASGPHRFPGRIVEPTPAATSPPPVRPVRPLERQHHTSA